MAKETPSFRRSTAARYASTLACIAIVTLYVASQRWNFFAQIPLVTLEVMGGVIDLHRGGVASWSITPHNWPWRHTYDFNAGAGYWQLKIPLYIPLIPVLFATAATWARPRKPACARLLRPAITPVRS